MLNKKTLAGRVLLVEDDPLFGQWLNEKLQRAGLKTTWVQNLSDALEIFQKQIFHAVIADIFLDEAHATPAGLTFIRTIQPSGAPTIMISSAANLQYAKEAVNHGASYILEKPLLVEEVINALHQLWEEPKGLQAILERFLEANRLTPREKEVARLVMKGLANKEIASIEEITDRTIKSHLTSIFQKCGVSSRTELFNSIFPT